jgi:Holliday junction resolvase-like predicted endonuclease
LEKNYRTRFGEIDIIARKGRNLIFTEVKTRTTCEYGDPLESINRLKVARIKKVANQYIVSKRLPEYDPSFNIISITIGRSFIGEMAIKGNMLQEIISQGALKDNRNLKIEHIENAF